MKIVLYYGMENKSIEVFTQQYINNRYQVITDYYTLDGKKLMFQAQSNVYGYDPPHDYKQYINYSLPIIQKGSIVSPNVIMRGYSSHNFDIVVC
jgi:tricorn protease-like protein